MEYLQVLDPLNNAIYFDVKSIGLTILSSELSSFTHDIIRKTLINPTAILEVDMDNRIYIVFSLTSQVRIINVIFNGEFWYAKDVDLDKSKDDLLILIQKNKVIYKK